MSGAHNGSNLPPSYRNEDHVLPPFALSCQKNECIEGLIERAGSCKTAGPELASTTAVMALIGTEDLSFSGMRRIPIETVEEIFRFAYAGEYTDKLELMRILSLVAKKWRKVAWRVLLEEQPIEFHDESAPKLAWLADSPELACSVRRLTLDFSRSFAREVGFSSAPVVDHMVEFARILRVCTNLTYLSISTAMLDICVELPRDLWDALTSPPHKHLTELILGGVQSQESWDGLLGAGLSLRGLRCLRLSVDARPQFITVRKPIPSPIFRLRELYIDVVSCVNINILEALLRSSQQSLRKLVVNLNGHYRLEEACKAIKWMIQCFGDSLTHLELEDTSMSEGDRGVGLPPSHSFLLDIPVGPCPNLHTLILAGVRNNVSVVQRLKCTNLKELWIGDHYSGTANYLLESLEQLPRLGKLWICDDWETPEHAGVAAWSRESRQKIVRHCRERGIELLLNLDWDEDTAGMDGYDEF